MAAAVVAAAMFLNATALSGGRSHEAGQAKRSPKIYVNKTDLQRLRWVEGTWRGTNCNGMKPFFKRYHFEGETKLVVETFSDEALKTSIANNQFDLKDGKFVRLGGGPPLEAYEVGQGSMVFKVSVEKEYSYSWQSKTKDLWEVVTWAEYNGKAKIAFFRMHRWKGPNGAYPCWNPSTDPPPQFGGLIQLPLGGQSPNPLAVALGF